MSKSKSKGSKGGAMPDTTILTKVKDASVTKSAHTPKAKSKEIAKQVATKSEKRSKHQKVKEPTPEPDSDSESEESASSVSASASEIESESEPEVPTKNGIASGRALANPEAVGEDDDSEEASGEDSASSESSDDEPAAHGILPATAAPAGVNGKSKPDADSSDESESSDSDEEGDKKKPAVTKKPINADQLTKKLPPMASKKTALVNEPDESEEDGKDSEDSEASSGSSDESSEDDGKEEEEEEDIEPKRAISKRKAEEEAAPAVKKAKTVPDANGSQGKNLFVGSLSWNVDEEWLTREFEEFGELTGVRIITDRNTGRSKGFGYVEFANAADAAAAHSAKQGADLDGRKLNVDYATSRNNGDQRDKVQSRAKTFGDQTSDPTDTLWIGNISFQVDQDQLSTAFQEYGTVLGVRLPTDRETGALKGFGYVTYSSVDEAKAAMETMQGADLAGRSLRLDFSQPRQNNGDSPVRGGRGGGRGGFGDRGRGGFGGRGGGRGGFGDRGGRGGGRGNARGGRGGTTNRGGFGDFSGRKTTF